MSGQPGPMPKGAIPVYPLCRVGGVPTEAFSRVTPDHGSLPCRRHAAHPRGNGTGGNRTWTLSHCGQVHYPPHQVGEGAAYTRRLGGGAIPVACSGRNECHDLARFHHRRDGASPPPGLSTRHPPPWIRRGTGRSLAVVCASRQRRKAPAKSATNRPCFSR
jgi:hypothetical protein